MSRARGSDQSGPAVREWPLIRRGQFASLRAGLGDGTPGFLLCGPAGAGKTRLAADLAVADGRPTWQLTCSPADVDIPLTALGALLDDGRGSLPDSPRSADRRVGAALDRISTDPVLVVADDLQWVDDASSGVLASLVRAGRIRLLGTARSSGPLPLPLHRLMHDDLLRRVDVEPLTVSETMRLVELALGGPAELRLARALVQLSGGNPLMVREIVRAAVPDGAIREVAGVWTSPEGSLPPSPRLDDLVDAELSRVPAAHLETLEVVANTEPVALDDALGAAEGSAAVDSLTAAGLVRVATEHGGQVLRMAHPVYAERVRRRTSLARRRELHQRAYAGARVESLAPGDLLRWISLALESGIPVEPADLVRAARAASALGQAHFALRMAKTVIAREDPGPSLVDALLVRAWERRFSGDGDGALADSVEAVRLLDDADDPAATARRLAALRVRADVEQYVLDDLDAALETVRSAGEAGVVDTSLNVAARLGWAGRFDDVLALLPRLESNGDVTGELLEVVSPAALALLWRGEVDRSLALTERYRGHARDAMELVPWALAEIYSVRLYTMVQAGRQDDLRPEDVDLDGVARVDSGMGRMASGFHHSSIGDWPAALQDHEAALQTFGLRDPSGMRDWALARAADAAAMAGEHARAAELVREGDVVLTRSSRALEADALVMRTRAALGLGLPDAAQRAVDVDAWARDRGFDLVRLDALHLLALADPGRLREHLADHPAPAPSASAPVTAALRRHVDAVVAYDDELARAAVVELTGLGRWPTLPARRTELSRREHEVASLVASGLSSPAIADRLHVSARTVETHLARIFAKLGVRRRSEVAAALARRHP